MSEAMTRGACAENEASRSYAEHDHRQRVEKLLTEILAELKLIMEHLIREAS